MGVATAGFLLVNHQIVTGLQIENGHWGYVWGIGLAVLCAVARGGTASLGPLVLDHEVRSPALCGFHLMAGVWFRVLECTRSRQMLEIQANYARYQEQRTSAPTQELAPNTVIVTTRHLLTLRVWSKTCVLWNGQHHSVPESLMRNGTRAWP